MFGVTKPSGSDMDRFKPCGDQATHFTNCMESPNVANFAYKGKKTSTTFETRPTICTSLVNEGKTQVGWVVAVRQRMQICVKTNNVTLKRSPYHKLNSDKIIMRSLCREAYKKY
jgi:hypothetical protein